MTDLIMSALLGIAVTLAVGAGGAALCERFMQTSDALAAMTTVSGIAIIAGIAAFAWSLTA